ncbi:hypothetical protein [Streptomyces mirabilis]|uniref:hypothetical protein n=1 Tax=Streptomyces mirabilis TaxID=68239 RepID=UPI0036997904
MTAGTDTGLNGFPATFTGPRTVRSPHPSGNALRPVDGDHDWPVPPPSTGRAGASHELATRHRYTQQVRQIAPAALLDREAELAELTSFCSAEDPPGASGCDRGQLAYVWWRAEAWAGKSAFLSWFVLHPPEGIEVAAFFITARYAGQNNREAFLEKAIDQLAALAGQEVAPAVGERGQQEQLFALYHDAAQAVRARGSRLVLVVDGLDEDRGITTGADAHSIAALLPGRPPAGMRIVVAGRPNPPIPEDVPADHPLRAEGVARRLAASPHALVVRDTARRELRGLLEGGGLGQDLLGLLTAAAGGLSSADLTKLTASRPFDIDNLLRAVSGRTFALRDSHFAPSGTGTLHILGHEELQQAAQEGLGPELLSRHRQRLHTWADSCRDHGWPADTPEYLLRGYTAMLAATGEAERLTALATDRARQERLLDISGGDAVALADISAAQEAHTAHATPDLAALARLAVHRDYLTNRNSRMPAGLPGVWERLGHPVRAENLARSLSTPFEQCEGLAEMAEAASKNSDRERVRDLMYAAEEIARSLVHSNQQAVLLTTLAVGAAEMGEPAQARYLARYLEEMGGTLSQPVERALCLAGAAATLVTLGDQDRARRLAHDAAAAAREEADPRTRSTTLGLTAALATEAFDPDDLQRLTHEAEHEAEALTDTEQRDRTFASLATALALTNDRAQACRLLDRVTSVKERALALSGMALTVTRKGDPGWVRELVSGIERAVPEVPEGEEREGVVADIAEALALLGEPNRAEALLREVTDPRRQAEGFSTAAGAALEAGDNVLARRLAQTAESAVRATVDLVARARELTSLACALALVGDQERARALALDAEKAADAIAEPARRAWPVVGITKAAALTGDTKWAERLVRSVEEPGPRGQALARWARVCADAGDRDQATQLIDEAVTAADALTDPFPAAGLRLVLARAALANGVAEQARALLDDAEALIAEFAIPAQRTSLLPDLLREWARCGQGERAERAALAETDTHLRIRCLTSVAAGLGDRDGADRDTATALRLIADAEELADGISNSGRRGLVLGQLAEALALVDDLEGADRLVRDVTDDLQRRNVCATLARLTADPDRVRRYQAEALRLGGWPVLLDNGSPAPEIASLLADEYAAVVLTATPRHGKRT